MAGSSVSIIKATVSPFSSKTHRHGRRWQTMNAGLKWPDTKLSSSVKMRESHEQCMPLIHLAPRHKLTEEYVALFEELEG